MSSKCTMSYNPSWPSCLTVHSFSQVRLIKNEMSIDNAIQVAIQFEQKTFQDSPDRVCNTVLRPSSFDIANRLERINTTKSADPRWRISPKLEIS